MKIQCVLRRDGGTKAEIDGIEYHFEPLQDGAHVANVEIEAHIDRFLSIPEGYKLYHGKEQPNTKPEPIAIPKPVTSKASLNPITVPLAGSEQHPPQFEIGNTIVTQREAVEAAFVASGLTSDEWNELSDDERAAKIDIALDALADDGEADHQGDQDPKVDATATREELVALYEAKFGKKPHYRASAEKIKSELGI